MKILERGDTASIGIELEKAILTRHGLTETRERNDGELGLEPTNETAFECSGEGVIGSLVECAGICTMEKTVHAQGEAEPLNATELEVRSAIEGLSRVGRWMEPQAPIDDLLKANGSSADRRRRCDWLLDVPGKPTPTVIEVDGPSMRTGAQKMRSVTPS